VCEIAEGANVPVLAADVRARHGLSQREFAGVLGIDIDTLQNWEQGRHRPHAAALSLVMAFDEAPDLIERTTLEPVL
jgi:putative transcriptional regulator